jgi:hypothetical protein
MPREITPALRKLLSAAGAEGALLATPNPIPGYTAHLAALGAELDADGRLVDGPATQKAKKTMAAHARTGRKQKAYARDEAKRKARAGEGA